MSAGVLFVALEARPMHQLLPRGFSSQDIMSPIKLEYRAIDVLIPCAHNAKQHTDAQVAQIAASIREFGWSAPIL